jgi:predicted transcriptional regulator
MRPPCEVIVRSVLPAFRSLIARTLVENYNFSQVAAAEKLGTTQASISHYLYSKRGEKMLKKLEDSPTIQEIVNDITEGIVTDNIGPIDAMLNFCKLCGALKSGNLIPDLNKECIPLNKDCKIYEPIKE